MISLSDIKKIFVPLAFPTAEQFWNTFGSFWHKSEKLPISQILGLREEIAKATTNDKGIHSSDALLKAAYPPENNKKDFYAFVGTKSPFRKWAVLVNGGQWIDTGQDIDIADIDMAEYAKKETEEGIVVRTEDGKIHIPENVVQSSFELSGGIDFKPISGYNISGATGIVTKEIYANNSSLVLFLLLEVGVEYVFKLSDIPIFENPYLNFYSSNILGDSIRTKGVKLSEFVNGEYKFVVTENTKYICFYVKHDFGASYPIFDLTGQIQINTEDINTEQIALFSDNKGNIVKPATIVYVDKDKGASTIAVNPISMINISPKTGVVAEQSYADKSAVVKFLALSSSAKYVFKFSELPNNYDDVFLNFYSSNELGVSERTFGVRMSEFVGGEYTIETSNQIKYVSFYTKHDFGASYPIFDLTDKFEIVKIKEYDSLLDVNGDAIILGNLGGSVNTGGAYIDLSNIKDISIEIPRYCTVNLTGDISLINADTYTDFIFEYWDSNNIYIKKNCEVAWQGHGSLQFDKKNFKYKLFNSDGSKCYIKFGTWIARRSFHAKANAQDSSYTMNNGVANYFYALYQTRPTAKRYPWSKEFDINNTNIADRFNTGARACIDGFPCLFQFNGNFHGAYTLNLNCFIENFNMSENDINAFLYKSELNDCKFTRPDDKTVWEEVKTDKVGVDISDEAFDPMKRLTTFLTGASASVYKSNLFDYMDKDFTIDYFIMVQYLGLMDNVFNNLIFAIYEKDGKMYPCFYDGDTGIGISYGGNQWQLETKEPDYDVFYNRGSKLFDGFHSAFSSDINKRYKELRDSKFLSVEKFEEIFLGFADRYPYEFVKKDLERWTNLPTNKAGNIQSVPAMVDWMAKRVAWLDGKYGYI